MPLPTIQPVDWPDWGAVPTFTTQSINVAAVASFAEIIAEIRAGYYSHALVVLQADGDGSSWSVDLGWYTATASEGGSLIGVNRVTRVDQQTIVVPMTCWAPILRITDAGSDTYPHNVIATVTLFTDQGFLTGYPGGVTVVRQTDTVPGFGTQLYNAIACGPGRHSAQLVTTSTDWNLDLITYIDESNFIVTPLADEMTVPLYNIEWLAPATSWLLVFNNNDAGNVDTSLVVVRAPL